VYVELVARMRAVLSRSNGPRHPRLTVPDLEIDLASRVVKVAGDPIQLSAKEYELLVALAEDPERVFKKEELPRGPHAHARLARQPPPAQAERGRRARVCPQRLGVGYRLVATVAS
jgi:hypothetical protein